MNKFRVLCAAGFVLLISLANLFFAVPATAGQEATNSVPEQAAQGGRPISELLRPSPYFLNGRIVGYRVYPGSIPELFGELGFESGDLVTAVDGKPLTDPGSSLDLLRMIGSGEDVMVTLERDGQSTELAVNSKSAAANVPDVRPARAVRPVTDIIRASARFVNGQQRGYLLYPGDDPEIFSESGLMPGDFLTEINGQSLSRPDQAYELFMQLARGEPVVFTLERNGEVSQLEIQVE